MKMLAEIWIGGEVRDDLLGEFCSLINDEGLKPSGNPACFIMPTAEAVLAEVDPLSRILHLEREDVDWGRFGVLESFLKKNGIAYTRRTTHQLGVDPWTITHYRPGMEQPVCWPCNKDGDPLTSLTMGDIDEIIIWINAAADRARAGHPGVATSDLEHVKKLLTVDKLPEMDDLLPFTITTNIPADLTNVVVVQVSQGQVSCVYCDDPNIVVRIVDWDKRGHGKPPVATEPDRRLIDDALTSVLIAVDNSL